MSEYFKDNLQVVHVVDASTCGGEFTFCGYAFDAGKRDDARFDGNFMSHHKGPATCQNCKDRIGQIRESLKGLKFSKKLISS